MDELDKAYDEQWPRHQEAHEKGQHPASCLWCKDEQEDMHMAGYFEELEEAAGDLSVQQLISQ